MKKKLILIPLLILALALSFSLATAVPAAAQDLTVFQSGGLRLVETQNEDGGWPWPLLGDVSATNTNGPIGIGLAQAYRQTNDSAMLTALEKTGGFLLAKTNTFTCFDGYLAVQLDSIFGGTTYTDYVKANFYDKLADGTYERKNSDGTYTIHTTESYIALPPAWDLGIGLVSATSVGIAQSEIDKWIAGVTDAINALNPVDEYYPSDLAGGLYGLAYAGETEFTGDGHFEGVTTVAELAEELVFLQDASGAFIEGMELAQDTAYALLALNEFDRALYIDNIVGAGDYLQSVQLGTGGWINGEDDPDPAGHTENNEMTGEALWALSAVGSGSVSMSASYIPLIGISVDPAYIDFGDVTPGVATDPETVTVTNTGNVAENFSASIENESPAGVYTGTHGLTMNDSSVAAWLPMGVSVDGTEVPSLVLTVPPETPPGTYTATLVFWAEAQ